jgi:hypothetical protein
MTQINFPCNPKIRLIRVPDMKYGGTNKRLLGWGYFIITPIREIHY